MWAFPHATASSSSPWSRTGSCASRGSANYTADDIQEAIDIAAAGMVPGDAIVSHSYGIEDAVEAFTVAAQGVAGKVVIDLRRATY